MKITIETEYGTTVRTIPSEVTFTELITEFVQLMPSLSYSVGMTEQFIDHIDNFEFVHKPSSTQLDLFDEN